MNKPARIAHVVSLALAISAAALLLLAPCLIKGVQVDTRIPGEPSTEQTTCSSLIEASGSGVIGFVLIPVVLSAGAFLLSRARMRIGVWICAVLVMLFSILTGFSIGLLYFPAAIALLVSAALQSVVTPRPAQDPATQR